VILAGRQTLAFLPILLRFKGEYCKSGITSRKWKEKIIIIILSFLEMAGTLGTPLPSPFFITSNHNGYTKIK